jgi:hypothetical protein
MGALLRAAYARPLFHRKGKSDSRGLTILGVSGNQTRERVSAIATHVAPKGDCRTLGLLAPHQRSHGAGSHGEGSYEAGSHDAGADADAVLLAAAAVRAHYCAGGEMQALEILLSATSQAAGDGSSTACSAAGEASPLTAVTPRSEAARRLMLAWLLELAVSVNVAHKLGEDGLATWHNARGGVTSHPIGTVAVTAPPAPNGALPPPHASTHEPPLKPEGKEDSDMLHSDVLVLVHVPRGEEGWWRAHGFVEPRMLPAGMMRSFAVQLTARSGGASRIECFSPDACYAPLVLAAVAKPDLDYMGTAVSAWREAAGTSTLR